MANFAVIEGDNVLNTIVAESKAIAEEVTGKTCVLFTTECAEPGGTYVNGKFIHRKPHASWILDKDGNWQAPVEAPKDDKSYVWDETTTSWVEVTLN